MKMHRLGIVLALACCGASSAKADWEYTKWGMTPQEVVGAANNLAKENSTLGSDSAGNVTKLVAPYHSGKFTFEAQFAFDAADKLASVTLVMNDTSVDMNDFMDMSSMDMESPAKGATNMPSMDMGSMNMGATDKGSTGTSTDKATCHALDVSLNTTYGPAPYGGAGHVFAVQEWQDQTHGNNVDYHALYEVGCYVQYSSITSARAH